MYREGLFTKSVIYIFRKDKEIKMQWFHERNFKRGKVYVMGLEHDNWKLPLTLCLIGSESHFKTLTLTLVSV